MCSSEGVCVSRMHMVDVTLFWYQRSLVVMWVRKRFEQVPRVHSSSRVIGAVVG